MRLIDIWDQLQEVTISMERLGDVLESAPEEPDPATKVAVQSVRGHVRFDKVSFRYSSEQPRVPGGRRKPQLLKCDRKFVDALLEQSCQQIRIGNAVLREYASFHRQLLHAQRRPDHYKQ